MIARDEMGEAEREIAHRRRAVVGLGEARHRDVERARCHLLRAEHHQRIEIIAADHGVLSAQHIGADRRLAGRRRRRAVGGEGECGGAAGAVGNADLIAGDRNIGQRDDGAAEIEIFRRNDVIARRRAIGRRRRAEIHHELLGGRDREIAVDGRNIVVFRQGRHRRQHAGVSPRPVDGGVETLHRDAAEIGARVAVDEAGIADPAITRGIRHRDELAAGVGCDRQIDLMDGERSRSISDRIVGGDRAARCDGIGAGVGGRPGGAVERRGGGCERRRRGEARRRVAVDECQFSQKRDPGLEWAPGGGQ